MESFFGLVLLAAAAYVGYEIGRKHALAKHGGRPGHGPQQRYTALGWNLNYER